MKKSVTAITAIVALLTLASAGADAQNNNPNYKREQTTQGSMPFMGPSVNAVPMTREFPQGSAPIADELLKASLTGKTAALFTSDGVKWTFEFKKSGVARMTSSAGFNGMGPWRMENGKICTQPRDMSMFCGEARVSDGVIYMRRENGEVVRLEAP